MGFSWVFMGFLVISSFFPCISKHLPVGAPSTDGGVHCQRPVRAGKAVQQWPGAVGPCSAASPRDPRFGDVPPRLSPVCDLQKSAVRCGPDMSRWCSVTHSESRVKRRSVSAGSAVLRCQDLEQGQQNFEDIQPSAPPAPPRWVPMMPQEAGKTAMTPMPKQVLEKQQLKQVLKYELKYELKYASQC